MNHLCKNCGQKFLVAHEDLNFYKKVSPIFVGKKYEIPPPKFCPDCRQQRRISWRNERSLYHRECSKTGKKIIAQYPADSVFPVYDNDVWWGDSWDGRDHGRDFDFSRPFFEQLMELRDTVPHFALAVAKTTMENSDYCNHAGYLKNCYLIYNVDYDEQCMYGKGMNRCFDCMDCFKIYDCEACYECLNSYNCKFCTYLWDSYNSSECHFSYNLIGCQKCFLSTNLQNQEYCFQNKKYSPEEWQKKVDEIKSKHSNEEILQMLREARSQAKVKRMNENNTENCTGDYLTNCKNCKACFDCEYLENSAYCYDLKKGDGVSYENYDLSAFGVGVIQCYEGGTVGYNCNHCLFGENVWESFDVHYSMLCVNNCKNCFGCVGLKKAEYCILNKQYTKEEYPKMVARIIEHMISTGEYGKFFPTEFSPFSYNETMAQEYFPLIKEQVLKKGWKWKDKDKKEFIPQNYKIPESILDVPDDICDQILACQAIGKNFKIQKAELGFYRKFSLPIPKFCPDERHLRRLKFRNPRKIWDRKCDKCGILIKSSYAPTRAGRPEEGKKGHSATLRVCCEKCYLEEVF